MRALSFVVFFASLLPAAVAAADPLFSETFENGSSRWNASDGNPIVIASDETTCSTSYQHETISTSGGRVFTNDAIPVVGGNVYCLAAWIRGGGGASPFLGLTSDSSGQHWLIGVEGYDNGYGGTATAVTSDDAWHWYAAEVTLEATTTSVWLTDELFTAGNGYADFDDIQLTAGSCATAYAGADQHEVCGNDAPVCASDGSCRQVTTPPGDMSGGSSSTPDMGSSSPTVSFPGTTQVLNPPAAVGTTGSSSDSGAVMSSGGCSLGGSEGARSLGVLILAFVAVMLLAIRRRRA